MKLVEVLSVKGWCNYQDLVKNQHPELATAYNETINWIYDDYQLPERIVGIVVWKDYIYYLNNNFIYEKITDQHSFCKYAIIKTTDGTVWVFKEEDLKVIYKFEKF